VFRPSPCWAETATSSKPASNSSSELPLSPKKAKKARDSKDTKENSLTAITVDKISDEQVTVKLSTLFSPRYGAILIPPVKDKKIWYFAINIINAKSYLPPPMKGEAHAQSQRSGSSGTFAKPLSHSLLKKIRATQYKNNPPIARVVFDLTAPLTPNITVAKDGLLVVFQKPQEEPQKMTAKPEVKAKSTLPSFQQSKEQKPAGPKEPPSAKKINKLTAVNVNVSDDALSIEFDVAHKPTYKSGLLPDKEKRRFYFYLNLQNTRSFVAGGKLFKQEIEDVNLTRVMVSQYRREPPTTRIVFYLNKFVKPEISFTAREQPELVSAASVLPAKSELQAKPGESELLPKVQNEDTDVSLKTSPVSTSTKQKTVSEEGKLLVKFPRAEGKIAGGQEDKVGKRPGGQESKGAKEQEDKKVSTPSPLSSPPKRANKLTEIKIDDKALNHITIQLTLNGIPDYRTVLMPVDQTKTADATGESGTSFYINFLNTTIEREKIFEKDISAKPLKRVRAVQYKKKPPIARVIFEISDAIKPDIEEKGHQLIVKFPGTGGGSAPAKTAAKTKTQDTQKDEHKPSEGEKKPTKAGSSLTETPNTKPDDRGQKPPLPEEAKVEPTISSEPAITVDESPPQSPSWAGVQKMSAKPSSFRRPRQSPNDMSVPAQKPDSTSVQESTPVQDSTFVQNEAEEQNVFSPPKQLARITNITAEVLPKVTVLNIDIEGEIELLQATYVPRGEAGVRNAASEATFSLKLAKTTAKTLQQINLNKGIIHDVILKKSFAPDGNPSEGDEKNIELLVLLSEKAPHSVKTADVRALPVAGERHKAAVHRRLVVEFENPPLERLVSLNFDKENLSTVMLMLSQQYGANIIAGSDLTGTVSIHATNVPLKEALLQVLQAEGYTYVHGPGGFLRVVKDGKDEKAVSEQETKLRKKVIELKYALATELEASLLKIVGEEGNIVAEKRTNSLIVTDTEENLAELEGIIAKLDKESPFRENNSNPNNAGSSGAESIESKAPLSLTFKGVKRIFRLSYISPDEASAYIQPLLSEDGSLLIIESSGKSDQGGVSSSSQDRGQGGTDSQLDSIALGGTIMVTDTEERLEAIQEIIEQIDVAVPQVEIQAYIVEGTITDQDNLGIDWRMTLDEGGSEVSASLPFGGDFPALNLQIGNLSADDFISILKILSARTDTKVLSSPKIMTIGNRQATFTSGDQIPYTELSITQDTNTIATTSFKDTGIILHVTATVKRDNQVSLTVNTEVSDVSGFTPTGQPRISQRKATTQVLVKDNDTAVIGGLIMERADETVSKVPILGDIPLLGRLFRTTNKKNVKSEVTVFITPRIVK